MRRWQQLSGPVAAKGVEDTAIYRFPALVSRDEVGGDPGAAPLTTSALHRRLLARARAWPGALTPLSTHDTKHSEDTRARIGVLAALSERYAAVVSQLVEHHDAGAAGGRRAGMAPSRIDELVLYQNLLGAWPLDGGAEEEFAERIVDVHGEGGARGEAADELDRSRRAVRGRAGPLRDAIAIETFRGDAIPDLRELRAAVAWYGALDGLSQSLLRFAAPGVPDVYQGCELWNLSLVDPDNRRPVDCVAAGAACSSASASTSRRRRAWRSRRSRAWRDGRIKLLVTARATAPAPGRRPRCSRGRLPAALGDRARRRDT